MIKMILIFLLFAAIFFCLIRLAQSVTGEQMWSVAKTLTLSAISAILSTVVLVGVVLLF